ncbi:MAG: ABC transporter permease [Planctomycetales bacterium]|nr:ABC transporter permease [Planctomycetales bacterium]
MTTASLQKSPSLADSCTSSTATADGPTPVSSAAAYPVPQCPAAVPTDARIETPRIVIESCVSRRLPDLNEIWRYRELLYFLTWRDIKVRYKQSVLGAGWAILQPLATMIVFSLFFGRIGQMPSGEVPYPIFVLAGLLPWFFFSNALTAASQSVVGSQNLITKVYFPRLLIPMAAVAAGGVDFAVSFSLLAVMMAVYGLGLGLQALLLPLLLLAMVVATLGAGLLLAALSVTYRDVRHVVPFMVQLWMFMTPAIYMHGAESFHPYLRFALSLNPANGLIANFRAATLGGQLDFLSLAGSGVISLWILLLGCWYFGRVERSFADVI